MDADFLSFLFKKVYRPVFDPQSFDGEIKTAKKLLIEDYQLSHPGTTENDISKWVYTNGPALPVFLYRFGNVLYSRNNENTLLPQLHWLMKEVCSMEIYFSVSIGQGFEIRHGEGSVIGSRTRIGKKFVLHQACTVGHRVKHGDGPVIGDNVEMGAGSSILGPILVGNNVNIGAHSLVLANVSDNCSITGLHK